ncbi:cytochrome P450 [Pyrrhoderma noxium]|uniref:Cytochrome P450 n=1 Tax=Pyrrhoderma noxium TaxID=2282107 RepID=A0A286U757_9AGAM|nr:cytochrome P450 [Pyrrhoderma noxium]
MSSVLFPVRLNLHTPSLLSPLPLNTLVETNDPRRTIMDLFSHLKLVNLDVAILSVISIWVASIWSLTRKRATSKNPKLPGPRGYPIIGNIFDMPTSKEWLKAAEWKETYGDLVFLRIFGKQLLFLNSYEAVTDIMEKRSKACSSRPHSEMGELMDWYWFIVNMTYGDTWRLHRSYFHRLLDPNAVVEFADHQIRGARKLVNSLIRQSSDFTQSIRNSVTSTVMMSTYGYEVEEKDDPYVALVEETASIFSSAAVPGAWLVEVLPWMKKIPVWFPGASFQRLARLGRESSTTSRSGPYNDLKRKIFEGTANSSLIGKLIEENRRDDGKISNEETIESIGGAIFLAGADTTEATLETFILAMLMHPDVQKRAQEELDRVVGTDRLPTLDDRENLPFVNAVIMEVMRWQPVAPLGVPHALTEDIVYKGYRIPKGTDVFANQWLLLNDPNVYPEPQIFKPERFLPQGNEEGSKQRDPTKVVFGFGRRICPGRFMALNSIFSSIVTVLATLNITNATDASGRPIKPKCEYNESFIQRPLSFPCKFEYRSPMSESLINEYFQA